MFLKRISIGMLAIFCLSCAGEIKGDKGEDATAQALITLRRPSFRSGTAGSNKIVVPASTAHPAKVLIKDKVYSSTSDVTCDLETIGRGGLDTGSLEPFTIYYLFAVAASSSKSFDLVASKDDPDSDPKGFSDWSYLGSFFTQDDSNLPTFTFINGRFWSSTRIQTFVHTGDTNSTGYSIKVPKNANTVLGFAVKEDGVARDVRIGGAPIISGPSEFAVLINTPGIDSFAKWQQSVVPIFESQKLYIKLSDGGIVADWYTTGWMEDVTHWN